MRRLKATSRDRCEKPEKEPRAANIGEKKKGREMVRVQHVTMKRIAGDVTQSVGSGYASQHGRRPSGSGAIASRRRGGQAMATRDTC